MPFAVLVLVASTNTVNLTDGLDGLAISTFAVSAGDVHGARLRHRPRRRSRSSCCCRISSSTGELTIFCGSLVGASLGFLWWNAHPADVFMGDVGSLGLGGALGTVALLDQTGTAAADRRRRLRARRPVGRSSRSRRSSSRGKRVFRMAPLHHHFELIGWQEPKVITRFLILAILFALFSLTTLKLR